MEEVLKPWRYAKNVFMNLFLKLEKTILAFYYFYYLDVFKLAE